MLITPVNIKSTEIKLWKLYSFFRYVLTGKLWVVMGAGWVAELLSTLVSQPEWLWAIVDLFNELQGVLIFLILIFKPKLYYLIRKRLGEYYYYLCSLIREMLNYFLLAMSISRLIIVIRVSDDCEFIFQQMF